MLSLTRRALRVPRGPAATARARKRLVRRGSLRWRGASTVPCVVKTIPTLTLRGSTAARLAYPACSPGEGRRPPTSRVRRAPQGISVTATRGKQHALRVRSQLPSLLAARTAKTTSSTVRPVPTSVPPVRQGVLPRVTLPQLARPARCALWGQAVTALPRSCFARLGNSATEQRAQHAAMTKSTRQRAGRPSASPAFRGRGPWAATQLPGRRAQSVQRGASATGGRVWCPAGGTSCTARLEKTRA